MHGEWLAALPEPKLQAQSSHLSCQLATVLKKNFFMKKTGKFAFTANERMCKIYASHIYIENGRSHTGNFFSPFASPLSREIPVRECYAIVTLAIVNGTDNVLRR